MQLSLALRVRRLFMGLQTLCLGRHRGYFIPYRYAAQIPLKTKYSQVESFFDSQGSVLKKQAALLEAYLPELVELKKLNPYRVSFEQSWFPALDASMLYALLRDVKPKRVIEVGSGHSTRFVLSALDKNNQACQVDLIDPVPRKEILQSQNKKVSVSFHQDILQNQDLKLFETLSEGDFLLIDSSHLCLPGSDVDVILSEILPLLAKGVYIHFHDIFLPNAYPTEWTWRGYNEQQAIVPLLFNSRFTFLWASHYVLTQKKALLPPVFLENFPQVDGTYPSSVWFKS
ncbi:MAG: class I SAM-dependent methyltransferase [Alphaproteobacteria bacterium]|nr:class I SAM-dependent methyltransferase [Alphaproteobacteria bacterium]MBP9876928.1 class I SAM-dependent methyltransferase [Alphaproteobacteria bacterium]